MGKKSLTLSVWYTSVLEIGLVELRLLVIFFSVFAIQLQISEGLSTARPISQT